MKRLLIVSLALFLLTTGATGAAPAAQALPADCALLHTAQSGETYWVCQPEQEATATASTATPTATVTQTSTPVPPTSTPVPSATSTVPPPSPTHDHSAADNWHAPGAHMLHDGTMSTRHEHGDAPPVWAGTVMFTHAGNTPGETVLNHKHTGFKGYVLRFNNVDIYVVVHLDTNPSGLANRFHSVQYWMKVGSNPVSYLSHWLDFGPDNDNTQTGPTIRQNRCQNTSVRPIIAANALPSVCPGPLQFESWYARPGGNLGQGLWMADFGFNNRANYYLGGDPADPTTWVLTGENNLLRRIEVSWTASRSPQRGFFYSDQFGRTMTGPTDPRCGTGYTVGTRTYTVLCIQQYIDPSLTSFGFPGNSSQKLFPGPVDPPN